MLKFAFLIVLVCIVWRWALGQWPWEALKLPPTREQEMAKARRLLGVPATATREEIVAAHKRVIGTVHPDRGGSSEAVHEANDARDLLERSLPRDGSVQDGS